jgi:hypothetical protein
VLQHGYHLYAPQTKVPLIVRVPGLAPRVSTTAVGHVDILPTLANLAGASPTPEMMGRSLVPLLAGAPDDPDRVVFQQLSYEGNHELRGAATADCHVLYNVSPHTSWEVYRLADDPGETHDRADAPGRCARVRATFERWYDSGPDPGRRRRPRCCPVTRRIADAAGAALRRRGRAARGRRCRPRPDRASGSRSPSPSRPAAGWPAAGRCSSTSTARAAADHRSITRRRGPSRGGAAGQFLRYTIHATVPPTGHGEFALWMGLFRGNARRPARGPAGVTIVDDRARVATMQVVR